MTAYVLSKGHPDREIVSANLQCFIAKLPNTKSWSIEITEYHKPRSDAQRSALFGVAYKPLMEHMGLRGDRDKEDLHEFFCGEYWGWHPTLRNKPLRTTTRNERGERDVIDTVTALDFYAFIQQYAAEQGVMVPDPDPFWREKETT